MRLYHFTCDHGARGIEADGWIQPRLHPYLGESFVWLTPVGTPEPRAIGLQKGRLQCDRMVHRFEVDTEDAVPWSEVRGQFADWEVQQLEGTPGTRPSLWYVSRAPIKIQAPEEEA